MFRIQDIKGTGDHIIAYKIIEKKYIDSIAKRGQIYFGLLEDYRKMEDQGKHEIGDCYEAALTNKVHEYINIGGEYQEIHGPHAGNNIRINANQCAFCFYMVGLKSFIHEADDRYRLCIPYHELKVLCKDKGGIENCAIIIFDSDTVIKIYDALKGRGFHYAGAKIAYDDYDYIPKCDIKSQDYALEYCFHKLKQYAYQNEFRIAVLNKEKEPIKDFFIDVEENEIQVLDLKDGYDFCSYVKLTPNIISEKIVEVKFDMEHTLEAVKKHET